MIESSASVSVTLHAISVTSRTVTFVAGATFRDVVSLFLAGTAFGDVEVSLFVAGATFGDVAV